MLVIKSMPSSKVKKNLFKYVNVALEIFQVKLLLEAVRKTKEMRLIHRLGTLNPNGINERFTFF